MSSDLLKKTRLPIFFLLSCFSLWGIWEVVKKLFIFMNNVDFQQYILLSNNKYSLIAGIVLISVSIAIFLFVNKNDDENRDFSLIVAILAIFSTLFLSFFLFKPEKYFPIIISFFTMWGSVAFAADDSLPKGEAIAIGITTGSVAYVFFPIIGVTIILVNIFATTITCCIMSLCNKLGVNKKSVKKYFFPVFSKKGVSFEK